MSFEHLAVCDACSLEVDAIQVSPEDPVAPLSYRVPDSWAATPDGDWCPKCLDGDTWDDLVKPKALLERFLDFFRTFRVPTFGRWGEGMRDKGMGDRGPWTVEVWDKDGEPDCDGVFLASDDFTHDVCMQVGGDFATIDDKKAYAQEIADVLNNRR